MCKCTPDIIMPFCGKPGCEWPDKVAQDRWRKGMAQILGELEHLYAQDKIGAVQINIVLRDGGVRTLKAYDNGFRVLLIAAAAIGQREAFDRDAVTPDADNWHIPG